MSYKGPVYGLSKECKMKAEKKFDINCAREVLVWMEAALGRKLHPDVSSLQSERDCAVLLKDGIALCQLMNAISPGSIKKINQQKSPFKEMENIELFTKSCVAYGMNPLDVFQMPDLYETKAMYTVINCLHALGSLAQKNGYGGPAFGVKIAEKKERTFSEEQIAEGNKIIPMQSGPLNMPSQAGMSPYGLSRQIVPAADETVAPQSSAVISLQYGTNKGASQSGMTPYGLGRQNILTSSGSNEAKSPSVTSGPMDRVVEGGTTEDNGLDGEIMNEEMQNTILEDDAFVQVDAS